MKISEAAEVAEQYAREIRKERDGKYGNYKIEDLGIKGLFVDVYRKSSRLKTMMWDGYGEATEDDILDNAIDLVNYALALAGAIILKKQQEEHGK